MIGALTGDIVGSIYEWDNIKTTDFPLFQDRCFFTDDSVLTAALAEAILTGKNFESLLRHYYHRYPDAGYGGRFITWVKSLNPAPGNSWGNGAAMRISPVGWAYDSLAEVLKKAEAYTAVTHGHPEGIKGAQAVAAAVFLGRSGASKPQILNYVTNTFGYDLSRTCDEIRPCYGYDVSCRGTVPPAFAAFLDSTDFESALRLAVSLGGDSDTLACITGSIAEAYYGGVPEEIRRQTFTFLDNHLLQVCLEFSERFGSVEIRGKSDSIHKYEEQL
jgi:ADP-ribosylglycohydrolase